MLHFEIYKLVLACLITAFRARLGLTRRYTKYYTCIMLTKIRVQMISLFHVSVTMPFWDTGPVLARKPNLLQSYHFLWECFEGVAPTLAGICYPNDSGSIAWETALCHVQSRGGVPLKHHRSPALTHGNQIDKHVYPYSARRMQLMDLLTTVLHPHGHWQLQELQVVIETHP